MFNLFVLNDRMPLAGSDSFGVRVSWKQNVRARHSLSDEPDLPPLKFFESLDFGEMPIRERISEEIRKEEFKKWFIEPINLCIVWIGVIIVVTGALLVAVCSKCSTWCFPALYKFFFCKAMIGLIPLDEPDKTNFIESNTQVLNICFTIAALSNQPSRLVDAYYWMYSPLKLSKRSFCVDVEVLMVIAHD